MRLTTVAGVLAVGLGVVALVAPELVSIPGVGDPFVTLVGVLALLQGVRYGSDWWAVEVRTLETGDPEQRYRVPAPGDDADEALRTATGWSTRHRRRRDELRDRLTEAAAAALVARGEAESVSAAEAVVAAGEWTADPAAAWFLGDGVDLPAGLRLRAALGREPLFYFGARRTIDAVAGLQED